MKHYWWLCLLFISSVQAETTDIYQPKVYGAGVESADTVDVRRGAWGFGMAQKTQENLITAPTFYISGQYFTGENWYVLGSLGLGVFSDRDIVDSSTNRVLVQKDAKFQSIIAGLGYNLMQGSASVSGATVYPWKLSLEGYLGEQFTGDSRGLYKGIGTSWQLLIQKQWFAIEWRTFAIDDQQLTDAKVSEGTQWGISFGSFF